MSDIEIITFGCRLNAYESEVMREHAAAAGVTDGDFLRGVRLHPWGATTHSVLGNLLTNSPFLA